MTPEATAAPFDGRAFRTVLGHFPTGVAAITALHDGEPVGMAVGSFTSVSLDPPLVAFLPDKGSSSFPKIREAGRFCVNVLSADQEIVCRQFATKGGDKFEGLSWSETDLGSPRLDGTVAWIDCTIVDVLDGGDHYIVLGSVANLDITGGGLPLLFFQGGYGRFAPSTLVAPPEAGIANQLRWAEGTRSVMQELADELDLGCIATSLVGDEMIIVASIGRPNTSEVPTGVGQRIPLVKPFGALWPAWSSDPKSLDRWLGAAASDPEAKKRYEETISRVRDRGWSIGLGNAMHSEVEQILAQTAAEDEPSGFTRRVATLAEEVSDLYEPAELRAGEKYDVRNITVPVFDDDGRIMLTLSLHSFARRLTAEQIESYRLRLQECAAQVRPQ